MLAYSCARPSYSGLSLGNRLMSRPTYSFLPHCFYSDSCSLSTALLPPDPDSGTADRQTILSWLLPSSDLNNDTDRDQQRKHIHLSIADNNNILPLRQTSHMGVAFQNIASAASQAFLPCVVSYALRRASAAAFFAMPLFAPLCFLATPAQSPNHGVLIPS